MSQAESQAAQDRRIDYIEFPVMDLAETKRFYTEVFGWDFTDYGPDYTSFKDGRLAGGFFKAESVLKKRIGQLQADGINKIVLLSHVGLPRDKQIAAAVDGIDLAQTSEYAWQRPSVEYWIGIARGAGIEVDIPECSDILKTGEMYAYQSHGGQHGMNAFQVACAARQDEIKGRMMEIQQTIAQHQQAVAQLQNQLNILAGAEENLRWNRQWWTNPNSAILQEQPSGNGEIHAAV